MNNSYLKPSYWQRSLLVISLVMALVINNGCSVIDVPDYKEPIRENAINSMALEPIVLPTTKLPAASLEQARDSYLSLMNNTNSTELLAESLLRLAEIESMIAENKLDLGQQEEMKKHLNLAANYYQRLMSTYPSKIDNIKINYQLARVLELEGKQDSSEKLLSDLANLKGSEFEIIEAGFRMAESAYSVRDYSSALKLYNQVLKHKNIPESGKLNSFYNTALFKRGWTHFKKQHYDLAVNDFIGLLRIIYLKPEERTAAVNSLITETYRVTAISISYMGGAETLARYFSNNPSAEFEPELYLALADLYSQQDRFQDTATTYFTFVKSNPESIFAPDFEHRGIEVLSKSGFIDLVLNAKENFVEHYQTGASYWQKSGLTRSTEVSKWLYKNLVDVINFHHAEAQQTKKKPDYLNAAKWYKTFLNSFPDHKEANNKRWLLAEALYDAGDNLASIIEYQTLAYQQNALTPERKEEAGFRVILARQNLLNVSDANVVGEKNDSSQDRQKLIDAGLIYKSSFIGAKRVPEVIQQTIELQLVAGQTKEAVALAKTMQSTQWATAENQKRSREVIADGEFDLKNYLLAEQAYTHLFNQDQYGEAKLNVFHQRRAQAIYKQAEALKESQQFEEAIEQFLRLATVEPNSEVIVKAEYDAATLLLQIEDYQRAVTVLEKFTHKFPKDPLTTSIPAKLIVAYEALEDWKGAANEYEKVASTTEDMAVARNATWQAATSWMKIPQKSAQNSAVVIWKQYIKLYPQPFDLSLEARNNLITLYGEQKVKWKQDFWRRKIIATVDGNKLLDIRARTLAAQSQLSLSNDVFEEYKAIKLTQPLKKSLKKKRTKLTASLNGFSKLLDYKIQSYSTQAGHKIGVLYAILAKSILDSDRPKGMSDIELEEYETLLEERVYPFEDEAIEALEANISLTINGVWDEWIQNSFKQLELLMPARYKKPEIIDDYTTTP